MTGGPMPYVLDIGPYLSVLEDRLADPVKRVAFLKKLRGPDLLSSFIGIDSTNLDGDGHDYPYRVGVLNSKWFGMKPAPAGTPGGWIKQPNKFPTGFWKGYQGDPESILREGLERAIEISLGIDYRADPIVPTRDLPIDVNWVCQGPFFQSWVTWQRSPKSASGRVSLVITTPAARRPRGRGEDHAAGHEGRLRLPSAEQRLDRRSRCGLDRARGLHQEDDVLHDRFEPRRHSQASHRMARQAADRHLRCASRMGRRRDAGRTSVPAAEPAARTVRSCYAHW